MKRITAIVLGIAIAATLSGCGGAGSASSSSESSQAASSSAASLFAVDGGWGDLEASIAEEDDSSITLKFENDSEDTIQYIFKRILADGQSYVYSSDYETMPFTIICDGSDGGVMQADPNGTATVVVATRDGSPLPSEMTFTYDEQDMVPRSDGTVDTYDIQGEVTITRN